MLEVRRTTKGPLIYISRTHKNFLRRLFELEVPEIHAGTVEVKAIAREAGNRSKIAVASRQEGLDPVGATVGQRGGRVQAVVAELGGEKIDVIPWHEDPAVFVANALSPAQVVGVTIDEEARIATVTVPERMLSLAIGREGQNARLAAKLTGWRIDIRSDQPKPVEAPAVTPPDETSDAAASPAEQPAAADTAVVTDASATGEAEAATPTDTKPAAKTVKKSPAKAKAKAASAEADAKPAAKTKSAAPKASKPAAKATEAKPAAAAAKKPRASRARTAVAVAADGDGG